MENDSSLNTTLNESALVLLPIGAVAFAPFLLLELVAAIVSNAILLALVILACVKKLNNNINIYLFSFAIGGLIGAFNIFCLLALVVARRWALGFAICSINYSAENVYNVLFIFIYLLISRDKLKGVKDPLHGRPTNKRAYVNSALIWVACIGAGIIFSISWIWTSLNSQDLLLVHGNFICFGLTSLRVNERTRFILLSIFLISFLIVSSILIAITLSNFVRIILELQRLKKLRLRFANESRTSDKIRINGQDKPLYHTGEERTAKSLTLVYFIQFSCILISYLMFYIQTIRNFALPPENKDGPNFQLYFMVQLIILFFPCINPVFLILSNKRLRMRVKELFKCTLSPEVEASPVHVPTNRLNKIVSVFALKTNKVVPLSNNENGEGTNEQNKTTE